MFILGNYNWIKTVVLGNRPGYRLQRCATRFTSDKLAMPPAVLGCFLKSIKYHNRAFGFVKAAYNWTFLGGIKTCVTGRKINRNIKSIPVHTIQGSR